MAEQTPNTDTLLRSGEYYRRMRDWYAVMYLGPFSERTLFLLIAGLSLAVALIAFLALINLLPLAERRAIVTARPDIFAQNAVLRPLTPNHGESEASMNRAFQQFFIREFIRRFEDDRAADAAGNLTFIRAHASAALADARAADRGPHAGPVRVEALAIQPIAGDGGQYQASATLLPADAALSGLASGGIPVQMKFSYRPFASSYSPDPTSGESVLRTQDPEFTVIEYGHVAASR